MKKNVYLTILAIITAIAIIFGSVYHIVGFGKKLVSHINTEDYTITKAGSSEFKQTLEPFDTMKVDLNVADFDISRGDDYYITYDGNANLAPNIKVENGCLFIKQPPVNGKSLFGVKNNCSIVLYIPYDVTLASIDLTSDVGDLCLTDLAIDTLEISCDVGDVDVNSCTVDNCTIETDTGDIDIRDFTVNALNITADIGDVDINLSEDLSCYSIDISADLGEVHVAGQNSHKSYSSTGTLPGHTVTITSSIGDISLQ